MINHHSNGLLLKCISLCLIGMVCLQSIKLVWQAELIDIQAQVISLLLHLICFMSASFLAYSTHRTLARVLLIGGFISFLCTAILLWQADLHIQYFFIVGLFVCLFLFEDSERIAMWITLCILSGLFLYFQIIHDFTPINPDVTNDIATVNAIVLVLSFLVCGFWVKRQFTHQNTTTKQELIHTKKVLEAIIPMNMQANISHIANGEKNALNVVEHNYCAVLFVDFAGFTPFSLSMSDAELVNFLHHVYCEFDDLASQLNVTKIKTNGDQYIAAIGIENTKLNAYTISQLACDFSLQLQSTFAKACDNKLRLKIGIASGNVLCGMIGKLRPAFDLWGNSVNLSSRLESSAKGGEIRVCPQTMLYSKQHYAFSEEQKVELKGIGNVTSYKLLGHK